MKTKFIITLLGTAIFVPMFASAQATTASTSTVPVVVVATSTPATFTLCSQAAIEKRDTAIDTTRNTYNAATQSALNIRKEALKQAEALATTTERIAAKKLAVENYRTTLKAAQNAYSTARKLAWTN